MCHIDHTQPYAIPLKQRRKQNGILVLDYSLLLGKVVEKRNGEHISHMGFTYPIGQTVYDQNAIMGDHGRCLHFTASPESAKRLRGGGYGSHVLGVLPPPSVWAPVTKNNLIKRCWHSGSATALFCYECDGIGLDIINNPNFWEDLKKPGSFPNGLTLSQLLADNLVWHQQVEVPLS
jgi:hypothetical protein